MERSPPPIPLQEGHLKNDHKCFTKLQLSITTSQTRLHLGKIWARESPEMPQERKPKKKSHPSHVKAISTCENSHCKD